MKKAVYAISCNDSEGSQEFIDVYENPKEAAWKFFTTCGFAVGRFDTLIHFAQKKGCAKISGMRKFELIELVMEIGEGCKKEDLFCLLDENWDEYYPQGLVLSRFEIGE